jgi:hypothetical protein
MSETHYASEHPVKTASVPAFQASNAASSQSVNALKQGQPYIVGGIIVALVLFLGYQQMQISKLTNDLSTVTDSVKSSDVKSRLETQEQSLGELNTRLAYLDSKINATDQKAQEALNRIKAHEDNDVIGNMVKGLKQTFGIK